MPYAVGLMSGTSLDGCDAALVSFDEKGSMTLIAFDTLPMPDALKARILMACSLEQSNARLLCSLNVELGRFFAHAALSVCRKASVDPASLACIGSHGQTVFHIPVDEGDATSSTLQLGEPAIIAYETGAAVISSFRAMDMAAGGRGAPLVPFADYALFAGAKGRAMQNIGGIGNVTVLPPHCGLSEIFAFDTGPGNMIMDALCQHFFSLPYDADGRLAAQGRVQEGLLGEWMALPFVSLPPPKATGRELYGAQFVSDAIARHGDIAPHDFLATALCYTAETIADSYRRFIFPICPIQEIILSGGGSRNSTLRMAIAQRMEGRPVLPLEALGVDGDAKEAMAFALLAYETLHGRPGNVPGATGASRPVVLGNITPGRHGFYRG